jgi:hypothetical protein
LAIFFTAKRIAASGQALALKTALGPDEALDRAGPHEEIGLTIGCMVLNDLLRRNENPLLIEPRVPPVFRIPAVSGFHSEFRFDDVGDAAAIQRLVATRRAQVIVGAEQVLEPLFVRPIRLFSAGEGG